VITEVLRRRLATSEEWVAKALLRVRLRPSHVTVIPPLFAWCLILPLLLAGHLAAALIVVALAFPLDAVDGAMARCSQQAGPWGHFCDLLADRVSDAGLLVGVLLYQKLHLPTSTTTSLLLTAAATLWFVQSQVTVLMSTLSSSLRLGWLQRTERITILVVALAATWPFSVAGLLYGAALLLGAEVCTIAYRCRQAYRYLTLSPGE